MVLYGQYCVQWPKERKRCPIQSLLSIFFLPARKNSPARKNVTEQEIMSIVACLASLDAYINPYSKHLICQLSLPFAFLFFSTHVELILTEYSSAPWSVPACISFLYAAAMAPSMIRLLNMLNLAYCFAMVVINKTTPYRLSI